MPRVPMPRTPIRPAPPVLTNVSIHPERGALVITAPWREPLRIMDREEAIRFVVDACNALRLAFPEPSTMKGEA